MFVAQNRFDSPPFWFALSYITPQRIQLHLDGLNCFDSFDIAKFIFGAHWARVIGILAH